MSYVWLTADKHHGHNQEFLFKDRNVKDLNEMNWMLIKNHNERVKPDDIVFHIGDFCFTSGNNSKLKYYEWEDQKLVASHGWCSHPGKGLALAV